MEPMDFLHDYLVHPEGHSVAVQCRGRLFEMPLWEGPAIDCTPPGCQGVTFADYMEDGRLLMFCPAPGESSLQVWIQPPGVVDPPMRVHFAPSAAPLGQIANVAASPACGQVAITNHRLQLLLLDVTGVLQHLPLLHLRMALPTRCIEVQPRRTV